MSSNPMKPILPLLIAMPLTLPLAAAATDQAAYFADPDSQHALHWKHSRSPLVEKVRNATRRFKNINVPLGEGWIVATPCVSGPNAGAMGIHLLLPSRLDAVLDADEPEALIYEPLPNGAFRLVGVEFIVLDAAWRAEHADGNPPPSVDAHLTNYVGAPNRYNLGAFHELHVWAWEDNPDGTFADWNRRVSCDKQQPQLPGS
jgi:hypothetical protein